MNTSFQFADIRLQLYRWPLNQPNTSLQAWDAADELLLQYTFAVIEQFKQLQHKTPELLLINDGFGALSFALAVYKQVQINDSILAERGTRYNREHNNLGI